MAEHSSLEEHKKWLDESTYLLYNLAFTIHSYIFPEHNISQSIWDAGANKLAANISIPDDDQWSQVKKPLIDNIINDSILEAFYPEFISKVPDDANKKLFLELIFLNVLSKFEQSVNTIIKKNDKQQDIADEENNSDKDNFSIDSIEEFKLSFYAILLDFACFSVNAKEDPQFDLLFILIPKIFTSNSLNFLYKFWNYMESRQFELIKFLTKNDGQYYKQGSGTAGVPIHTTKLIGRRRPGLGLLRAVNELIDRFGQVKDNIFTHKTEFLGRIRVYLSKNFSINDPLYADQSFTFNEQILDNINLPIKRYGDELFFRFWKIQEWLANPLLNYPPMKQDYVLKDQKALVKELTDITLQKADIASNDVPEVITDPNRLTESISQYLEHGDPKFVEDFYQRTFIQDKLRYYNLEERFSGLTRIVNTTLFDKQKANDSKWRLEVLVQIYIVNNFMFNNLEKYKKDNFVQMTNYFKKYDEFIEQLNKNKDDSIALVPQNPKLLYNTFKEVYATLVDRRNNEYDYYLNIKKTLGAFFSDYSKSLYFTTNSIVGHNDLIWFSWKLNKFNLFNIAYDKPTFDKSLDEVSAKLKASSSYENLFGIQFGNRNLTKILTAQNQFDFKKPSEEELTEKLDKIKEEIDNEIGIPDPNLRPQYSLSSWKRSRYLRKRGLWLKIDASKLLLPTEDEANTENDQNASSNGNGSVAVDFRPQSIQKRNNDRLKRKLEELNSEVQSLVESNNKKLKNSYILWSKDDQNDGEDAGVSSAGNGAGSEDVAMKEQNNAALDY